MVKRMVASSRMNVRAEIVCCCWNWRRPLGGAAGYLRASPHDRKPGESPERFVDRYF